jgi:hypothetical protein
MQANPSSSVITPILGAMLVDGPLRLITLGQELFADLDEKSLGEVGFKDGQVSTVYYYGLLLSDSYCHYFKCVSFAVCLLSDSFVAC